MVEVLVALMLLTLGVLGLAGSSAITLRGAASAAREREAAQRALTRLAILASSGCGGVASGTALDPSFGWRERWTVARPAPGVLLMSARVEWPARPSLGSLELESALLC